MDNWIWYILLKASGCRSHALAPKISSAITALKLKAYNIIVHLNVNNMATVNLNSEITLDRTNL